MAKHAFTALLTVGSLIVVSSVISSARGGQGLFELPPEKPRLVPAPALDSTPAKASSDVAVLAGGCFWGIQGIYQHTKGVLGAVSGYAGGEKKTASYERVGMGKTGHAEAVQVTFDPRVITYGQLLQIFFSVAHDPTQLDRQTPDVGPQYRSAVFPMNAEQANIAKAYIGQLSRVAGYRSPIMTNVEPGKVFYRAEDEHQDYVTRHPRIPYIVKYDLPKIDDFKRLFPEHYRPDPVLVFAAK
jgi:peptide-methionine (S)-S-oxide reductase